EEGKVTVSIPTPKARHLAAQAEQEKQPSVLAQVATDLRKLPAEPAWEVEPLVEQLAEFFRGRRPRSGLLVGPSGVGQPALVRELVRRSFQFEMGTTPFWTTSGARLVAGMSGFGMWQERCTKVVQEAAKKRAIVHLGNLVELMHVGKSEYQTTGVAAFLRS